MTPPRRHQSQTERDFEGLAAKRDREAAPVEQVDDDFTGRYEGAELANHRAERSIDKRVGKLEIKHDKLDDKVDVIDSRTSRIEGKLDTALAFITEGGKTQRAKISTNGKVIIAIVTAAFATIGIVLKAVL